MVSPGREVSTAIASEHVDLHASERPRFEPDHIPPPTWPQPESGNRVLLYVGVALVLAFLLILLLF